MFYNEFGMIREPKHLTETVSTILVVILEVKAKE